MSWVLFHHAARVLVVGIGPLGRLTGKEIEEAEGGRLLVGYLRFDDEAPHERLHATLLGTVEDLETTLRERLVDEVCIASVSAAHAAAVEWAVHTCEDAGADFALPAIEYRLSRARPATGAFLDGYIHYRATWRAKCRPLRP
jgi:hypothetical protein